MASYHLQISNCEMFFQNQESKWLSMETIIGASLYQALPLCICL